MPQPWRDTHAFNANPFFRARLRAPRFDEAVFKVAADAREVVIDIKVAK